MVLRLAVPATLLAALAVSAPSAGADTVRTKAVRTAGDAISCYATIPAAGRGIVCTASSLKSGPKTHGLDPVLLLSPRGRARFTGQGDYSGYDVRRPARLRIGDRWVWHGIVCTVGKDGMTCLNKDDRGFNVGPAGYTMLP